MIAQLLHSPKIDSKILKTMVESAKSLMQSTKAATSILLELHYSLKSKTKLHAFFTNSGLDIAECMKADKIEGDPKQRQVK